MTQRKNVLMTHKRRYAFLMKNCMILKPREICFVLILQAVLYQHVNGAHCWLYYKRLSLLQKLIVLNAVSL